MSSKDRTQLRLRRSFTMTREERKENFRHKSEQLDAITKPIRNAVWLLGIAAAIWVQFLGPGITSALREASGSNELAEKMDIGFQQQSDRLDFIEDNIRPPVVVNWNFHRQLGECDHSDCRVLHNISRTAYGENCGVPTATAQIKLGSNGEIFDLPFGEGFEEAEATRAGRNFIVPFSIPDIIPVGRHQYQITNVYPTCRWIREPIPRKSPWFDIFVAE